MQDYFDLPNLHEYECHSIDVGLLRSKAVNRRNAQISPKNVIRSSMQASHDLIFIRIVIQLKTDLFQAIWEVI